MYATVSTKGQITIPAPIRDRFGLRAGRRVGFRVEGDSVRLELPATVEDVRAMLQTALKANGTWGTPTVGGDGWAAYVEDEYGQS